MSIAARLRKLETGRRAPAAFLVLVGDHETQEEAIERHKRETGARGPFLIAPVPCGSAEAWEAKYCDCAGGPGDVKP